MLHEIRITGLGVIDDAVLPLHPGLTVLTGETGAGKTMVVHGLGLLLGSRADSALVRAGRRATSVEGLVRLQPEHPARTRALDAGAELDDDELVLARTVSADGRSRAFVGGRAAPVGLLAELGEHLVAVHGQADQWRLRRPDQHREALDGFGGTPLAAARAAYTEGYAAWRAAVDERDRLRALDRDRARESDALTAALEQVERVDPQPGEDLALRAEDERLAHAEGLREAAGAAHTWLAGRDPSRSAGDPAEGAAELLARARAVLGPAARHDERLAALDARVAEAAYLLGDLAGDLAGYLADLDADPARLAWVQQRRADLAALTRRYGDTVDEVLAWSREAAARLDLLVTADERGAALDTQVEQLRSGVLETAAALTAARRDAAARFERAVTEELGRLAMGSARVLVAVTPVEPGPHGADEVEIQLAHPGAAPRSVAKSASGGELSRLMLALEVVTGAGALDGRAVPTFVFDEVDAGVGGVAALHVGARLAALAAHAQVVVVTHLAQVAAYADRHLVVRKDDDGAVTSSAVTEVEGAQRLGELARMMGGGASAEGLEHARVLLETAAASRAEPGFGAEASAPPPRAKASTRHTRGAGAGRRAEARAHAAGADPGMS